jgi:hypothetical protein
LIRFVDAGEASGYFARLPPARRIATLSPAYVAADAVRDPLLKPVFLLYEDARGFWLHGAHLAAIPDAAYFDLQSAYGYGGPVADCDDPAFRADAWRACEQTCTERGIVVEFVRLHPLASWQAYPGTLVSDRQVVTIDMRSDAWRASYEIRCRNAIRKARKAGVEVVEHPLQDVAGRFADYYRDGMHRIGAASFYLFSDKYFQAMSEVPGLRLLACVLGGEWLAAGLFLTGGDCIEYHLSATSERGRKLSATNLLIDAAAQMTLDQGLSTVYLGGGTDASPDNALLRFKASFSPLRLTYCYGYAIHDPASYAMLRTRASYDGSRVLFYR